MTLIRRILFSCPLALICVSGEAGEKADIIVDAKGGGNFVSIQQALNSLSPDGSLPVMILIRNGMYNEKVFITRSKVTLVGEDQNATRIVFAELRENWNAAHNGSDWGSGVVNIDTGVTDIVLANLTVYNNYGSLHGTDKHQFAIRGMGTRIMLLHCNVVSDGGDALSLWNKDDGMYYHNDCAFEGGVDFVCPRGWCYITNSRFFGHNLSASIWHDGDRDPQQKFVITNSFFDGVAGFPLGRNHRDGQFFLIHCRFSANMADRPIYHPPTSKTQWQWGPRHYYFDCHRDGGDFSWFRNNIETAAGSPRATDISASWTFDGKWDPEATMASVLPFAFLPSPVNSTILANTENVTLSWVAGRNAVKHRIAFGPTDPPAPVAEVDVARFEPGTLEQGRTYFWRVDTVTDEGIIEGKVWSFTTRETVRP